MSLHAWKNIKYFCGSEKKNKNKKKKKAKFSKLSNFSKIRT